MSAKGTADTSLVKQPYAEIDFSPEELQEFMKCCDPDQGPLYFMTNFMYIQHPTKGRMLFEPFDYQLDLIHNYNNFRRSINMLGRQMGKTTVAAGYLLWYAMFNPDSEILIASNKGKNASDIMRRVRYAYESCPDHIRAGATEYNKGSISFDNGSRIVAETTTETTGRGMSISLVYLDEFAFVKSTIAQEFWTSLSPTLSTGGKCIVTSTPNSDEDQFATIWRQANRVFDEYGHEYPDGVGINGFRGYKAIWDAHPDRDEEWARQERASIGEDRFKREHCCEFIIFEETLLDPMFLTTLEGKDPVANHGQVRWYKIPNPDFTYVITLDPSTGTGSDFSAIQVVELPTLEQVAEWTHNRTPVEGQIKCLMEILFYLQGMGASNLFWSVESNAVGEGALVVIRDTGEENFPGEMLHEPRKVSGRNSRRGFYTTNKSKLEACLNLKRLIEQGKMKIRSKPLISEFKNFVARRSSFAAKQGEHDDAVMALVLAVRLIEFLSTFEDDIYNAVNADLGQDVLMPYQSEWDEPMPLDFL